MNNFAGTSYPLHSMSHKHSVWTAVTQHFEKPSPQSPTPAFSPKYKVYLKVLHSFRRLHNVEQISCTVEETEPGKGQALGNRTDSGRCLPWHNKCCVLGRFTGAKKGIKRSLKSHRT